MKGEDFLKKFESLIFGQTNETEIDPNLPDRLYETFLNKTIFVTGGTGYVGKGTIERMLRLFDVKQIYVLIRTKRDRDPTSRLQTLLGSPLFEKVREMKGEAILEKVKAIAGDITLPRLNLSQEEYQKLTEETEFVIHSAATVRFDESLKVAVTINTKGTLEMLQLAKEMKNLQIFIHISTAYCHPEENILRERIYKTKYPPEDVIKMMEWLSDDQVERMTEPFLDNIPNTYTFSKALAEDIIASEMDNLPLVIVRPSIVTPIWKEPIKGWTDSLNGPVGLLTAAGKGVLRSMYGDRDATADFVSVDAVADVLFSVTAHTLITGGSKKIFNICTSNEVKLSWGELIDLGQHVAQTKMPFDLVLWSPGGNIRKSRLHHKLVVLFCQLLPALIVDALAFCCGYKPFLWKIQKRILAGMQVLEYYTMNQWTFDNANLLDLRGWLNPKEKSMYTVTIDGLNVMDYFESCAYASRKYILKEPDENLPRAKRNMKIMVWIDRIWIWFLKFAVIYMIGRFLLYELYKLT